MKRACAVLYCHLWPVRLYNIFPQYLRGGVIESKYAFFLFSPQLLSGTFHILGGTERGIVNVRWSLCKVPVILTIPVAARSKA